MEEGHVAASRSQIFYQVDGDGPAVLFLHAGVADSRMWRSQLAHFAVTNRVAAFDQRGFGRTNWMAERYADWRDAVAVMDQLDIEAAVIVGCSNGGGIAMHLAIAAPERVTGLILVGAAARGWEPVGGWSDDPLWDEAAAASKAGDLDRLLDIDARMWLSGPKRRLDDIDPDLVALFIEMDRIPATTESERGELVVPFDPPTNDRLGDIVAPTLAVVGEYDLPDIIESTHYLAGRLSDRDAVVIADAAHLPSFERPQAFNAAISGFLSKS